MPLETLESRALTQRAEVGRALAEYAEAEAALRLEVARSWPDLVLGPGFVWDGGVHRWNLLASLPELMLNRNRGPIGEATARRAAAAVHVDAMQQEVLADVATARAACTGAIRELATSDSAVSALAHEAAVVAGAVERGERGERDRLAISLVAGARRAGAAAGGPRASRRRDSRWNGLWAAGWRIPRRCSQRKRRWDHDASDHDHAVLAGLVLTACSRRSGAEDAEDTEAPVASPSRLQNVDGAAMVVLDSSDERRLDLAVTTLTSRTTSPAVILTGEVVADSSRTSVVRAPIAGRLFQPEGTRWPRFGETVRAGQVLAQVSDARPLAAAVGGVVTRCHRAPGRARRCRAGVARGHRLLVAAGARGVVCRCATDAAGPHHGHRHRPAPARRSRHASRGPRSRPIPSRGCRHGFTARRDPGPARVRGCRCPPPWRCRRASGRGAFVPQAAVVQWDGLIWVFRRRGTGHYERVRVPSAHAVAGGWLVPAGDELVPGDTVVVRGAQVLLSEEFKVARAGGDEVAE
jgi:hypothetical protein